MDRKKPICYEHGWLVPKVTQPDECAWSCRSRGFTGLYQGFPMGLASSITGAGFGFATYEALTVAYRKRVGHSPSAGERGALAGMLFTCY